MLKYLKGVFSIQRWQKNVGETQYLNFKTHRIKQREMFDLETSWACKMACMGFHHILFSSSLMVLAVS